MKCKKCGKQKILVKHVGSQMWVNLDSLTSEEIRECQTIPNSIIRFRPGAHILHYTTCKEIKKIKKKSRYL